jgi:hypothetical protein
MPHIKIKKQTGWRGLKAYILELNLKYASLFCLFTLVLVISHLPNASKATRQIAAIFFSTIYGN